MPIASSRRRPCFLQPGRVLGKRWCNSGTAIDQFSKMTTRTAPRTVLRTSPMMYALFGGIIGAVFILAVFVAIAKEPGFWFPTTVMGIILAGILSWLATTTLTLSGDVVRYRSLFVSKNVRLADIVRAKFSVGFISFKPYQRLVLTVRKQRGERDITINTGLFDRAEIRQWVDALNAQRRGLRRTRSTLGVAGLGR
jgi:hypothetical protein